MKKKFIKKIILGGLISSLCLCCCFINVNASVIDSNSDLFDDYFYFEPKEYSDIQTYNDLKGTIWHLNFDFYDVLEPYGDFNISLSFLQGSDEDYLFDLPFIVQLRNSFIKNEYNYSLYPNADLSIAPLCNSNSGQAIILNGNQGGAIGYLQYYNYFEQDLNGGVNIGINKDIVYQTKFIRTSVSPSNYYCTSYQDISILSSVNINNEYFGSSEIYLFFPNNSYIIEEYTNVGATFLELLKRGSTMVNLSNSTVRRISSSYQNGYNQGYSAGFEAGTTTEDNSYRFTFLTGIFNGVSDLLSIEIFPNVELGYFVFVPLALGITGMIFWFWRKD